MSFDREKENERRVTGLVNECKFFTGIQHERCDKGVEYNSLRNTDNTLKNLPCLDLNFKSMCSLVEYYTREEAIKEIEESNKSFEDVIKARKAITDYHGKSRGVTSQMECPICKRGILYYSISSYNGHIHGQCSTLNCVNWME